MSYYNRDNIFNLKPLPRGNPGQPGQTIMLSNITKVVGITNVYNNNLLLEELKQNNFLNVTCVIRGYNDNFQSRTPNTDYQCRMSVVGNTLDLDDYGNKRLWYPFLPKEYKLSSVNTPNWNKALQDGYIRLNDQNLMYFGDLKGQWQPNTEYKKGDLVYIQSNYPTFMGFPEGQIQTFVYVCMDTHTSDSYAYSDFFDTNNDYIDTEGKHVFPIYEVNISGELYWNLLKLYNSSLRQWWFWNNNTNSVKATLYTEEMFDLYYPYRNERIEDVYSINYLLQIGYDSSSYNPPHTLYQQNGMIVDINGTLTLWTSNWWKTSYVKSNSDTGFEFPLYNSKLKFIEDGDENGKFLWGNANDNNYILENRYYDYKYFIVLPIDINIKDNSKILFYNFSANFSDGSLNNIFITNISADYSSPFQIGQVERDNEDIQTITTRYNQIQGIWYLENT